MRNHPRLLAAMAFVPVLLAGVTDAYAASVSGAVSAKKQEHRKHALVYLEHVAGTHAPPAKPIRIDQKDQTFRPFVAPIVVGTTVEFLNSDPVEHNVFSPDGEKYDLGTWSTGQVRARKFDKPGVYTQLCKLHPAMLAYIVVLQNPYFAFVKEDGTFEIANVPPGEYKVTAWAERKKAEPATVQVADANVTGVQLELRR